MSDLGLNNHHTDVVANYLAFTKLQRVANLKTIDALFQDVFDSRLFDSAYTVDEVQEILYSLRKLLKGELESGLMDLNHMNILLLQQLFSQAENWHLRMDVNLSELQNRSLLDKVKDIDQNGFAPIEERIKKSDGPHDPIGLLQIEIKSLKKGAQKYEEDIHELNEKIGKLNIENQELGEQIRDAMLIEGKENLKIVELQEEIRKLRNELKNSMNKNDENSPATPFAVLENDNSEEVVMLRENLLQAQSRLKLAEQELDRKFKETTAFANMKKLLDTKNEQMRELREKIKNMTCEKDIDSDLDEQMEDEDDEVV